MSIAISNAIAALKERLDKLQVQDTSDIYTSLFLLGEKVTKLEGEIRAMKARMGRNPPAVQSVKEEAA